MLRRQFILFLIFLLYFPVGSLVFAQEADIILQDVLELLAEQDPSLDIEQAEEDLRDLAAHPININNASSSDLERLLFLSSDQIDDILLYAHFHPFNELNELKLIGSLKDYELRNLMPFVCVKPVDEKDGRTVADIFRYASHELDIRADVRNPENFKGDPLFASLKYKLNAGNKVLFGATLKRDAGELLSYKSRYGAYLQLNNVWRFRTIVAGDYKANFGLGLVMNSALPLGKSALAANLGMTRQGLSRYNGTSSDFMRGAGATLRLGDVDVTAFYSFRQPDSIYRQTAGLNISYRKNRLLLGATAVEYWTRDSVAIRNNYYNQNYFRGTHQASVSLNAQYAFRKVYLLGEVAASENRQWGYAALLGARYLPVQDVSLLLMARHFSPTYDAHYASTFSETSRANDEQGIYFGADVKRLRYWRFSAYADFFRFSGPKYMIRNSPSYGYDIFAQADYLRSETLHILLRARAKRKGSLDHYSLRYQQINRWGSLSLQTQVDFSSAVSSAENLSASFGGLIAEQVEYKMQALPIVLQARVEGFYVPDWNGRIYAYENDVLYAFSIPATYGIGARYYLNMRYRISNHFSLYLKAADTWYTKKWAAQQAMLHCHKTDVHVLLRITY